MHELGHSLSVSKKPITVDLLNQTPGPDQFQMSWRLLRMVVCRLRGLVWAGDASRESIRLRTDDLNFLLDEVADQLQRIVGADLKASVKHCGRNTEELMSCCQQLLVSMNSIRSNVHFFGVGGNQTQELLRWLVQFFLVDKLRHRQFHRQNY